MIAVIFEVQPKAEHRQQNLDIAASLKPILEGIEGFISVERFQSLTNEDKILSLSFFEDEKAIERWRQIESHRKAQEKGRQALFADYRLRIAGVIRDYGLNERDQAPEDSRARHDADN
ncbi:MAG: antibiotic biosynthesis monooxygenase [Proteobacteria bacterium]|nr:antibiotic biosynthesis monooxygenase [Pseudomonadota bacterium]